MMRAQQVVTSNEEVERVRRYFSPLKTINNQTILLTLIFLFSFSCAFRTLFPSSAHHNDLENILPYLIVGLFYVMTDPQPMVSTILFKVATIARFCHTFVYAIYVIPQPARTLSFFVHYGITFYMAFMSFIYFV